MNERFNQLSTKERQLLSECLAGKQHKDQKDIDLINNMLMELAS